jgi:hypothetical protein
MIDSTTGGDMAKISRVAVWLGFLLLLLAALLAGQAANARITGDVQDEAGNFLAGVEVTAINIVNRAETKVFTGGDSGSFRFLALAPGFYQVSFDLEGYKSYVASGIQLSADQSATLHIKLEPLLGPDGTPIRPQAERPKPQAVRPAAGIGKKWQLELAVGALYGKPDDLNNFVAYDYWLSRDQALKYLYTYRFMTFNLEGISMSALEPLGDTRPLTARVRYSLSKTFSLALGIGYFDHQQVSVYSRTYAIINSKPETDSSKKEFTISNEFPDFRLGTKGFFPHAGMQGSLFMGQRLRLAAFAHAGWTFAECRYSSQRRFRDGWTDQDRFYEVAMNGKGNGFTLEGGAKFEVALWRGLGIFVEGLYQSCRLKNVTGERIACETVNDAGAPDAGNRTTVKSEGSWVQAGTGIIYPYILSPGEMTAYVPFTLDLGGPGFRAGVFFRF